MLVEADVHGVRVAEQVVQVAEDFLVRADEEHAQVIRLAGDGCSGSVLLDVAAIDEPIDLAVRIACDVTEHRMMRGRQVRIDR